MVSGKCHKDQESRYAQSKTSQSSRYGDAVKVVLPHLYFKGFTVHREIITRTSELFRQHFTSLEVAVVEIDEEHPINLGIYIDWLYTGILRTKDYEEDEADEFNMEDDEEYRNLLKGYFLGVKLEDSTYCDTIIDALFDKARECGAQTQPCLPDVATINEAYSRQTEDTVEEAQKVQKTFVEIFAREKYSSQLTKRMKHKELNDKFKDDLAQRLMGNRQDASELDACKFHQHTEGEDCSSKGPARKRRGEE